MPGGWAAQKYGGRVTLTVSFLLWSTGSLLTPRSAHSTRGITAARVLVGIAQGGIIPSIHTVLSQAYPLALGSAAASNLHHQPRFPATTCVSCRSKPCRGGHGCWSLVKECKRHPRNRYLTTAVHPVQWIPPHERAKAVSLTTSGMYLGSAAAMLMLPYIAAHRGPGSLLLLNGGLGYIWRALWLAVGRDIPRRWVRSQECLQPEQAELVGITSHALDPVHAASSCSVRGLCLLLMF